MKKINSFEAACKKLGKDPKAKYHPFEKLEIIVAAIVGKWEADYKNSNQKKWFCIFWYDASVSAFRFGFSSYDYTNAIACSGVRLSLETEEQADYFGNTFEKEWNDLLLRK